MSTPPTTVKLTVETLRALVEEREKQKAEIDLRNRAYYEEHLKKERPTLKADQSMLEDFFKGDLWKRFVEHLLPAKNIIYICHSTVGRSNGEYYAVDRGGNLYLVWLCSSHCIWDTRMGWNIVVTILGGTTKVIEAIKKGMQKLFDQKRGEILL